MFGEKGGGWLINDIEDSLTDNVEHAEVRLGYQRLHHHGLDVVAQRQYLPQLIKKAHWIRPAPKANGLREI